MQTQILKKMPRAQRDLQGHSLRPFVPVPESDSEGTELLMSSLKPKPQQTECLRRMHSDLVSKSDFNRNTWYEPSGTVLLVMQIDYQLAGPAQRQSEEMLQRIDL